MNDKFVIFSLLMLIVITCSATVYADDSLDNLTAPADVEVEAIVQDADLESGGSEIIITDETYDTYFNKYTGKLRDMVSPSVDTIKIGNVSNKVFTIDRPLNIMPISSGCEISNGVIHLIQGSSGSNITNLVINNTKGELYLDGLFVSKMHGIWFSNSSDNLIFNNTIRIPGAEGCYAMPMGYSSRNRILYNDIVSTFTSCILMGLCDYNNISYNRLEVKTLYYAAVANIIYFNPYGHADYNDLADCVGTYISNNYIKNVPDNTIMEFTVNLMGKSDNTTIINNTIINGNIGITISSAHINISGNTIVNCTHSIIAGADDVEISDNLITGSSMDAGIIIFPEGLKYEDNASVFNNTIIYDNLYNAISLGRGVNVYDNTIILSRYGVGISDGSNNSNITYNRIYVVADDGISLTGNNSYVSNNIIHTKANGISSIRKQEKYKAYNNTIRSNKIYSDKYGVYIEGYVYNTTIKDNYIETNESDAFHIDMYTTLEDRNPGQIADNTINGIIKDTEILVIDDSNFYDYFDSDGYLKYDFKTGSQKILFLSFLTNKNLYFTDPITLTSNKQANLLYNVTIILTEDASDSTIRDFKFYNFDKESIILDGVENVVIKGNEFTTLAGDNFESKTISVIRGCNFCNITDNSIFINSKSYYTYAISVSEPQSSLIKRFSSNFTIKNNNIIIMSCGVAEAMYFDSLVESEIIENSINIISDGSAYGIAVCDVIGRPHDILIKSNKIVANSKDMSYLVELYRADNCNIIDNYIKATSNGVYAIGVYNSSSIVNKNEIIVAGRNLTSLPPSDVLGKGNSAVYLARQSLIKEFLNNIIDSHDCEIITNDNSIVSKMKTNSYVISNYNYDLYFNSNNKIDSRIVKDNDIILFKDFTDPKTMGIDVLVTIKPYKYFNKFNATLVLLNGSDKSIVSGFNFNDADIRLNGVSNILIHSNNFTDSRISDYGGVNNNISNNSFVVKADDLKAIIFKRCLNDIFAFNKLNFNSSGSRFIVIEMSNQTGIFNNSFVCVGDSAALISSSMSNSTDIFGNYIIMNATGNVYAYFADNSIDDKVFSNNILINSVSGSPVAIYYNNSYDNEVMFNSIVSSSDDGQDYAIVIDSQNNTVTNNYLVSSNGFKKGDDAVHAPNNTVHDNIPVTVYVSVNGTQDGNGSFENPYPTIRKAVENCLNGAVICILPGMYNESGIVIDKNVTLTAINLEGNTYINALNCQLFNIKKNGILTVNALKIFNGFSVEGGALFNNLGTLMINNSVIYNSSSYYNNSNPTFKYKNKYDKYNMYSYDCSNLGLGGAILNRGELVINSSTLYDNFAHKGGAIADFGKTTIVNSLIYNNTGVHGGAIYTNSKSEFTIENSEFMDNLAIQTLDYCSIKKIIYEEYPNLANLRYRYLSDCETLTGMGGAIFSNSILSIDNSLFDHNIAKYGGAIAYDSSILTNQNYYHESLDYDGRAGKLLEFSPNSILNIKNSYFKNNEAKNTSCGNLSMLVDDPYGGNVYGIHAEGGAIFGAIHDFNLFNSSFTHNLAESNGGALCVQSLNSSIEQCVFNDNTAGESGGALDLFGNVNVFNTEITNNSAKYGGAVQYSSFDSYGRIQYNAGMFNLTVSGNRALEYGGAFAIGQANFAIKNSNIYDNTAPRGSTFSGTYGITTVGKIDARNNWWGSTDGPDDSVFMQNNIRFRTWAGQKIDWTPIKIKGGDGDSQGNGNRGNGQSQPASSVSTGSGTHTGSTLTTDTSSSHGTGSNGFNFNGNWPTGNNNGNWGGNFGDGEGVSPYESSGNSRTSVNGNAVNPSSLSKSNSSSVDNLASVGMTANAADSSPSAQSSSSEGGSGEGGKAYEITKDVKKEIIDEDLSIFNVLFILLWIFLFIGFYRKYRAENN